MAILAARLTCWLVQIQAEPGLSKPVHSILNGAAIWGWQKPWFSWNSSRAILVQVAPTFWASMTQSTPVEVLPM